ncbi:MAG: cupin domain-containing protein [Planctomycetota bacterium]
MKALFDRHGKLPADPADARRKLELIKITPDEWQHLVHGRDKHVHVSLMLSTDYAQVGHIRLFPGSHSELENHAGDEVIYMLKNKMAVRVVTNPDLEADAANANRQHFELCEGEAFLIPEGFVHQYINLTDKEAVFFFGIGPDF